MGPQLPTIPDLAQLQFLPPGLNQMAGQQIQTAQQSADQGLALGAQDLQAKQLQNMFDAQNNSTKLLRGKADLAGVNSENIIKDIEAKQRTELAPEELEAKRSKFVKALSDDKLEKALNDAQQMMLSDDPNVSAKGKDLYMRSGKEVSARAKAADDLKKQESENASRERVAAGNNSATLGAAKISAAARTASKAGAVADLETSIQSGKIKGPAQLASAYSILADNTDDPEKSLKYRAQAQHQERLAQTMAPAVAGQAGKIDAGAATGMPVQQAPSAFGATPPAAPAASKSALPPGWTMK